MKPERVTESVVVTANADGRRGCLREELHDGLNGHTGLVTQEQHDAVGVLADVAERGADGRRATGREVGVQDDLEPCEINTCTYVVGASAQRDEHLVEPGSPRCSQG